MKILTYIRQRKKTILSILCRGVLLLEMSLDFTHAFAVGTLYPWDSNSSKIYVNFRGDAIKTVLDRFCMSNGCSLNVESGGSYLSRRVNGSYAFDSNTDMLNFLSNYNNFSWYYYDKKLFITSNKFDSTVVSVPPDYLANLKKNLIDVGLYNDKFGWTENYNNSTVIITGPSSYVSAVKSFMSKYTPLPSGNDFAVIKLKYANAADVTLNLFGVGGAIGSNTGLYVIPGVATIINTLTNPQSMQQMNLGVSNTQNNTLLKNVVSSANKDPSVKYVLDNIRGDSNTQDGGSDQHIMSTSPLVQADTRNNSIIIFDKNANLPMYQNLVKLLDVPQTMLQINTTIIDLNEDDLNTEGINWVAEIMGVGVGFNSANVSPYTNGLGAATANNLSSSNQMLVPTGSMSGVIANINFLAQDGKAKIQSTPSVVTLNELPAITAFSTQISLSQQSMNKGEANASVAPAQVSANSSIVIIPHEISKEREYRLEVSISSNQLLDQNNTAIVPIINGGSIQTQAVVKTGDGLLLGGYTQERQVDFVSQVPFLGSIPLIGWFFKSTVRKVVHYKRVYLITVNVLNNQNIDKYTTKHFESGYESLVSTVINNLSK